MRRKEGNHFESKQKALGWLQGGEGKRQMM